MTRLFVLHIASTLTSSSAPAGTRRDSPEILLANLRPLPSAGFVKQFAITLRVLIPNAAPLEEDGTGLIPNANGEKLGRTLHSERFVGRAA